MLWTPKCILGLRHCVCCVSWISWSWGPVCVCVCVHACACEGVLAAEAACGLGLEGW